MFIHTQGAHVFYEGCLPSMTLYAVENLVIDSEFFTMLPRLSTAVESNWCRLLKVIIFYELAQTWDETKFGQVRNTISRWECVPNKWPLVSFGVGGIFLLPLIGTKITRSSHMLGAFPPSMALQLVRGGNLLDGQSVGCWTWDETSFAFSLKSGCLQLKDIWITNNHIHGLPITTCWFTVMQ